MLFVVRYSLVPGGKFAKLAKLVAGSCNVAITKTIRKQGGKNKKIRSTMDNILKLKHRTLNIHILKTLTKSKFSSFSKCLKLKIIYTLKKPSTS